VDCHDLGYRDEGYRDEGYRGKDFFDEGFRNLKNRFDGSWVYIRMWM